MTDGSEPERSDYHAWVLREAARAGRRLPKGHAKTFFSTFARELRRRPARSTGDRRFIEQPLAVGLVAALASAGFDVRRSIHIDLGPESPIGTKEIDVLVMGKTGRRYCIEQKTIFETNSLGAAALAGWAVKRWAPSPVRFAALFHHAKVADETIAKWAPAVADSRMLDQVLVLWRGIGGYDAALIDALIDDIRRFVGPGST